MKTLAKIPALALVLLAVPALAQTATRHKKSKTAAPPTEIACSQFGCQPVPRGCRRAGGRTPDGTPTGFDVADCGSYTLYGLK